MAELSRPKVCLFDIGGVCVVSPFKAIVEYEIKNGIPPGYINFSISKLTPNGAWHRLERGEIPLDKAHFFDQFKSDLERADTWREYHQKRLQSKPHPPSSPTNIIPPVPTIDAESLFWTMMRESGHPDPYMYPALVKLRASGLFHLAALSNTSIFPPDAPITRSAVDVVRAQFDVFVSSAHVGMRKPARDIYDYTMKLLREKWGADLQPSDVLFLDDIGENLKTARSVGWRTIRVYLGRTKEAVQELEKVTGLKLLDEEEADRRPKL